MLVRWTDAKYFSKGDRLWTAEPCHQYQIRANTKSPPTMDTGMTHFFRVVVASFRGGGGGGEGGGWGWGCVVVVVVIG